MIRLIHLSEAFRMLLRSRVVRLRGTRRYRGDAQSICRQIINDAWDKDKKYLRVSSGHFSEFFCRDFGLSAKSLIELGYKSRVRQTLDYALSIYRKHGRICVAISPGGVPFDFPDYAPDSLAFLLYSLCLLEDRGLVDKYKGFLEKEIRRFFDLAIDKGSGLIRADRHFSSMKDYSLRKSSCYDNCMAYLVQRCADKLGLHNPLAGYDYEILIVANFWTGRYFLDDLSGKSYVAGDANLFPFWTGAVTDENKLRRAIRTVREHGLDSPFPLRYTHEDNQEVDLKLIHILVRDYERHVVWTHMGPLFMEIVGWVDGALQKKYMAEYRAMIERYGNYLEVFYPNRRPYHNLLYYSDEGMIWCANYLALSLRMQSRGERKNNHR